MRKFPITMAIAMLTTLVLTTVNCVSHHKVADLEEQATTTAQLQANSEEAIIETESFANGAEDGTFFNIYIRTDKETYDVFTGFIALEFKEQPQGVEFTYSKTRLPDGSDTIKKDRPFLNAWQRQSANILVVHYYQKNENAVGLREYGAANGQTFVFEYLGRDQQLSSSERSLTVSDSQLKQLAHKLDLAYSVMNNQIREFYLSLASTQPRSGQRNWREFIEGYKNLNL